MAIRRIFMRYLRRQAVQAECRLLPACLLLLTGWLWILNNAGAVTITSGPSSCINSGNSGTVAWTDPQFAAVNDGSYASVTFKNATSDSLRCTGYNFSAIPADAVINGITVNLTRGASDNSSNSRDSTMYLLKGGTATSFNGAITNVSYTNTMESVPHGGSNVLWGTTWTPAEIINSNFGVVFAASTTTSGNTSVWVKYVEIAIDYSAPSGPGVGGFNAFDTNTPLGAITGMIQTKVAGSQFNLSLIALNPTKNAISTTFAGAVKVELLDASAGGALDPNGCNASWSTIQTLGTNPTFVATDNGRKTVAFQENNAWRNVRVRITYSAVGSPTIIGCSTDNFAIRPASLANVSVTDANWSTAGTARTLYNMAASGGNVHKAGLPFSIGTTAVNGLGNTTGNYNGSPQASVTACLLPNGCTAGMLSAGSWSAATGTVTANAATYSEAGTFSMQLVDSSFASVDATDGTPQTCAGGYVCSPAVSVGRFVPDYFDGAASVAPQFLTFNNGTCVSRSFTYIGQQFGYRLLPQAMFTAKNANGAPTVNYRGTGKVAGADVNQLYSYTLTPASTPGLTTVIKPPTVTASNAGTISVLPDSTDTLTFNRGLTAPQVKFTAAINLAMSVSDFSESSVVGNGIIGTTNPALFNNIAFDAGNEFRYGRLKLANAFGSERLDLPVPVEAQYWNGLAFITNVDDNCTVLDKSNVVLGTYIDGLNTANMGSSQLAGLGKLASGKTTLRLTKPLAAGSVDLAIKLGAGTSADQSCPSPLSTSAAGAGLEYLQSQWCGSTHTRDPRARVRFGVYKNASEMIYVREMY